ncbi:hypothetical protein ACGFX8_31555 [Streptomyces sp. NPDC048362]|uniref:hypothetical protein n=1 Tax=Streptomyces sp. NPDC048362 TaxID=3365539 RepID=UPI00371EE98B
MFRAPTSAASRDPEHWTPGRSQDIAVRVRPVRRARAHRPGDDQGTMFVAATLVHPDTPLAAAYRHGRQLCHAHRGRLRCETPAILGVCQPARSEALRQETDPDGCSPNCRGAGCDEGDVVAVVAEVASESGAELGQGKVPVGGGVPA